MLFDIDGTLLNCGRVAGQAAADAAGAALGRPVSLEGYEFSGKTDPQILRELMEGAGASRAEAQACLAAACAGHEQRLRERLRPEHVRAKPGVAVLLAALQARPEVVLGLLTGNLEPCARMKLAPLDLNRAFPFGAFGSDDPDRYHLVPVALERARSHSGRAFDGAHTVVIGDSVHDVLCGRSVGVRAVAVATGRTSRERLAEVGPHALLDDLADTAAALEAILGET